MLDEQERMRWTDRAKKVKVTHFRTKDIQTRLDCIEVVVP
jgi:hypothetical protein